MSTQNSISAANDPVYKNGDRVIFKTHGPRGIVEAQGEIVGTAVFPDGLRYNIHNLSVLGQIHIIPPNKVRPFVKEQHQAPHP